MATLGLDIGFNNNNISIIEGINEEDALLVEEITEAVIEEVIGVAAEVRERPPLKRVKEYIKKVLRLNIYISIYYRDIYKEYRLLGLLNILAEEKYYK